MSADVTFDFFRPLIISLSILILSTFFYRLLRHHSAVTTPSPHSYTLIGLLRHRHRLHDWLTATLSATPSLTLHLLRRISTANPINVQHLLRSNFHNYTKPRRYTAVLQELTGTGIVNSDGKLWSGQRQLISRVFATSSLRTFVSDIVRFHIPTSLLPHLTSTGDVIIDLQQVFSKFSFDIMFNIAFGIDPCSLSSNSTNSKYLSFVNAFDFAVEHVSNRFMSPLPLVWKLKRYFNVGDERKFKQSIETLNQFIMELIKSKETRIGYKSDDDLLSRLMDSSCDMGFEEDERRKFLRDNIISFIFAGKDTTSTALTWFFWLLDKHPHCTHLIHKELLSSSSSSSSSSCYIDQTNLTFDELNHLNYLHAALSESMRLFPPVPMNSRSAVHDDVLPDGTYIEQGCVVDYSAYAMGRMETLWGSDCREFKPERWLDDDGVFRPPQSYHYKYPVFNGGSRMCLGKEMAYFVMKAVVVAVLREFEVAVVGGGGSPEKMADPLYSVSMFLRMKDGLPVRVKKRENNNNNNMTRGRGGDVIISMFGVFLAGLSFYKHKQYKKNCIAK